VEETEGGERARVAEKRERERERKNHCGYDYDELSDVHRNSQHTQTPGECQRRRGTFE
jgi:hypothetical protein